MAKKTRRLVVVSDFQIPFVKRSKIRAMLKLIKELRPDIMVVNGDLMDYDGISKFPKEMSHDYLDEVYEGAELLRQIRCATPRNCERWYTEGNHEQRLRRRAGAVDPYLRRALQWSNIRGCEEYEKWGRREYFYGRKGVLRFGPVLVFHGKRTGSNANMLEAIQLANMLGGTFNDRLVVMGHTHIPIQPTKCRKSISIDLPLYHANTGCFCDPNKMEWTHTMNTDAWAPGIGVFDITGRSWEGEVVLI